MRKLKTKYKWTDRESHFLNLARLRKLKELYGKSFEFGFRGQQIRTQLGILSYINGREHWTDEQVREISTCLTKEGALEKVAGTTNPEQSNSSHSFDGFPNA